MAPKRVLDEGSSSQKTKKTKFESENVQQEPAVHVSSLVADDVDFPRGGGTTFTPLEVKEIRAEAVKEANEEMFEDAQNKLVKKTKGKKRKSDVTGADGVAKSDKIRIEQLNYKKMNVGMKILGQIISIQPLALVVSLPNQLLGHVPITQISSELTHLLENMDKDDSEEEDEEEESSSRVPDLFEIFQPGQYVRAVVTALCAPGSTDLSGIGRTRDEVAKASRRVELSLLPERVNTGTQKTDLREGYTLSAAVKSVEDHGYILNLGLSEVTGFLSFKDTKKSPHGKTKLPAGRLVDVTVLDLSSNGRTCNVIVNPETFVESTTSEVTNVTSVLPGTLVQSLITAVSPAGINLQILGYFEGTVDVFHAKPDLTEKSYKVGKKIKARVLYDIAGTPPRFALSLADHVISMGLKRVKGEGKWVDAPPMADAFPVGTALDSVKVVRVEAERGLVVEVAPGLQGFIHISNVSDEHVPSLSTTSGHWKIGSLHRARVTGSYPLDGILQLSAKASVLDQKFLQVGDVQVGEVIKGTIKVLNDSGLFVSMSGNVDGVVWPTHFSDITLKQPSKRFKAGASIKCRVLAVDPERRRIKLTCKKTLIDSELPLITKFEDAKVGLVVHAVVAKVTDKHLLVEFYNGVKAVVPHSEASETAVGPLTGFFPVGRVVKVRIIVVDADQSRLVASIRQGASSFNAVVADISAVEIGNVVDAVINEVHNTNVVLTLKPTNIKALLSLKNLANHRDATEAQLRVALKTGDKLESLIVVKRHPDQGIVIVACPPKPKLALVVRDDLSLDKIQIGQAIGGRVFRHNNSGAQIRLSKGITAVLHPTDASDNYETGTPFPAAESIVKAVVVSVDVAKKVLTLSSRPSRMYPGQNKVVVDPEIKSIEDLKVGESVRGFIKTVAEHGLFVTIGRGLDARVQIKELFDEYVKEWKGRFTANQLVKGRITKIDRENKKIEMSFRSGDLAAKDAALSSALKLSDLVKGQKLEGRVRKVEDYGIFINIEGSKLSGLCHKSELSDNKDADVTLALRGFREGDRVKVVVLSIDMEKKRLSLGLKPSYFEDQDFSGDEGSEDESEDETAGPLGTVDEDEDMSDAEEVAGSADAKMDSPDEESNDEMDVDVAVPSHSFGQSSAVASSSKKVPAASLKLNGFQWNQGAPEAEEVASGSDSSSDEDEEAEPSSKKNKKKKRKVIEQDLTADMHTKTPESNADFERLLLGSPNSSYLWMQYMSFQMQLSEIDKAREIGQRAIKAINFREEQERMNIWIGLLNLENVYGTDETLEATFQQACKHHDSKTVHLRLALILDQTNKPEKAEALYQKTVKKFGTSSKAWTLFGQYYLQRGEIESARLLLQRSLKSLEKRKHIKTICKFGQLEYKMGDAERGKSIFEGLVDAQPKRWDLWTIYMDMEAGQSDIQSLRNIFERVLAIKMTSKKAKSFFKKWLQLEQKLGDEDGQARVKSAAVAWTQRAG